MLILGREEGHGLLLTAPTPDLLCWGHILAFTVRAVLYSNIFSGASLCFSFSLVLFLQPVFSHFLRVVYAGFPTLSLPLALL